MNILQTSLFLDRFKEPVSDQDKERLDRDNSRMHDTVEEKNIYN